MLVEALRKNPLRTVVMEIFVEMTLKPHDIGEKMTEVEIPKQNQIYYRPFKKNLKLYSRHSKPAADANVW